MSPVAELGESAASSKSIERTRAGSRFGAPQMIVFVPVSVDLGGELKMTEYLVLHSLRASLTMSPTICYSAAKISRAQTFESVVDLEIIRRGAIKVSWSWRTGTPGRFRVSLPFMKF